MSEFKENYREFWVYRNEEYAPTYACDFNQRGFVPSRNRESIHVIEYAALEQAEAKIRELQLQLADRTEKYHLFIESGLDQKCREVKELEAKLEIAVGALKCNETFHRLGGIDDCEPCLALEKLRG